MFNWLLSLFGAGKKPEPTSEAPYKLEPPTLGPESTPINTQPSNGWPFPESRPVEGPQSQPKKQHHNRKRKPKAVATPAPVAKKVEAPIDRKKRTFKKRNTTK